MTNKRRRVTQKVAAGEPVTNKKFSTSVQLDGALKDRVEPYLFLRDKTLSGLVAEALAEYIKRHPLAKYEREFWAYRQKVRKEEALKGHGVSR